MAKVYLSSMRLDLEAERRLLIDWLVGHEHQPRQSYTADSETVHDSCKSRSTNG